MSNYSENDINFELLSTNKDINQILKQAKEFKVKKLSTENKELYGSVKPTEISKIINENINIKINPSLIQPIKEIKALGTFKIILNLHSEIQAEVMLKVEPEENTK